jgi:hypothetical protein
MTDVPVVLLASPTEESQSMLVVAIDPAKSSIGGFVQPIRLGETGYVEIVDQSGAAVMIFSAVMGLLVWFVVPSSCSVIGSLQILVLGFLFILGGLAFLLGKVLLWKHNQAQTIL